MIYGKHTVYGIWHVVYGIKYSRGQYSVVECRSRMPECSVVQCGRGSRPGFGVHMLRVSVGSGCHVDD